MAGFILVVLQWQASWHRLVESDGTYTLPKTPPFRLEGRGGCEICLPRMHPEKSVGVEKQIKPAGRSAILPFLHQALRYEENPAYRTLLTKHAGVAKCSAPWTA
jgi:hypothetical protein